jgi:nucleoside-diphosphate-sugar epimerase
MSAMHYSICVIFGGSGFIGSHFAKYMIQNNYVDKIYIVDIVEPRADFSFDQAKIHYINADVRSPINSAELPSKADLIVNLAAVHREPGHENAEYYETNLYGAENVCAWAEMVLCSNIIFTSSIAPYGPSEESRDETSLPVPITAYGASKLVAEKIHMCWQSPDSAGRYLLIVRPGVVFGPGERGNVSRLIKAVLNHYFFYMGNRDTRKAGIYVKELCIAMWWALNNQHKTAENVCLLNMSMNPGPSIEDYVKAVCKVAGVRRWVPSVPYAALLGLAFVIDSVAKPMRIKSQFSPVRIKKLVRSNNIMPTYLTNNGYLYRYTLEAAFADWKECSPEEWA